jgi:hypothetical protein
MTRVSPVLALLIAFAAPAQAQDWLLLQGIGTVEGWGTDSASTLLSHDNGHPSFLTDLQLFAAAAVRPNLQLLAMGEYEGGTASDEPGFDYDQLELRYIASAHLVVDIGKMPTLVGAFAYREYAPINPLVGSPDGFVVTYPWTVAVSGTATRFDYRAALVSLPATHAAYVPDPGSALHAVLGGGYTPSPEVRIGASATWGPYLNDGLPRLPAGTSWSTYQQKMVAFDNRVSIGYVEWRTELALSRYDVPTTSAPLDALAYYTEGKVTWSPRLFAAVRVERNDYALIQSLATSSAWTGRLVNSWNAEAGLGYRLAPGALFKLSFRRAWWLVGPDLRPGLPDGYALAAQVSYQADVRSWFDRPVH